MEKLATLALFVVWIILLGVLVVVIHSSPENMVLPQTNTSTPLKSLLIWQSIFYLVGALYILIKFKRHLKFLATHHPTLGNFTNIKYTSIRFISVGDWLFLLFSNNIMLVVWYFIYFKGN